MDSLNSLWPRKLSAQPNSSSTAAPADLDPGWPRQVEQNGVALTYIPAPETKPVVGVASLKASTGRRNTDRLPEGTRNHGRAFSGTSAVVRRLARLRRTAK